MMLPILIIFSILFLVLIFCRLNNKKVLDNNINSVINGHRIISDEIPLSEKYPNLNAEELFWLLENKDLNEEELTVEERNFLDDNGWSNLALTLERENSKARNLSIQELISNDNKSLSNEHGNPYKELINFTLFYFESFYRENSDDAENSLLSSFPTMHFYIKRKIFNLQNDLPIEQPIDEQISYDEFLIFCTHYFSRVYPNKKNRDKQIKLHFTIMSDSLIDNIDSELINLI